MKQLLIIVLSAFMSGCAISTYHIRVLQYPDQPLGNRFDSLNIKRIRLAFNSDSVILKLIDKRKLKIGASEIWGYQDEDSSIWRYEEEKFFLVRQLDTPTIYSRKHSYGKGSHNHYYFSADPRSQLYSFRWKDIKKEFSNNKCFLDKLENLNFFQGYDSYDRKQKSYRFVMLYKECRRDNTSK